MVIPAQIGGRRLARGVGWQVVGYTDGVRAALAGLQL